MKLNKSSILALMTLGGLMAFGPLASADDQPTKPVPPPDAPPPANPPPDAPPPRAGGRANMEKILGQLNLTDDQKEKVKPILKDQMEQMKALRGDTSLTPEDRRGKVKDIHQATNAKLKTIFNTEQIAEWQKLSQPRGHRKAGTPPPADAPTTPPPATGDSK